MVQPGQLMQRGHWDMSYDTSSSSKVLSAVNEVGKQGEEQHGELIQMTTKGGRKGKGIALLNTKGDTWDISGYYYDNSEQVPRIFTMSVKEEKRKDDAKKKTVTKEEADKKELSDLEKAMQAYFIAGQQKLYAFITKQLQNSTICILKRMFSCLFVVCKDGVEK